MTSFTFTQAKAIKLFLAPIKMPHLDASSITGRFPDSPQSRSDKLRGKELIKAKKTKAGRFTFPSMNLKQEIVLIFASTPRRCSVVQKADINETGESDHRPVMADFLKNETAGRQKNSDRPF
ncbi:MAG: hypothetical protein P8J27_10495 [Mariniblastus sp.]|nr:hypothetical protein [Mariniblastus sp.]